MSTPDEIRARSAAAGVTYVVVGGNHVTVVLSREQSGVAFDVIEVSAAPGGGPPPHRHEFAEWFRVLDGELTLCEERGGAMRVSQTVSAGGSVFVAPWRWHATLNLSNATCRFEVIGQPAMMSGYFAEAGVAVNDPAQPPDRDPPGPADLREISRRWGIEFWTGPIESPPLLSQ